MPIIFGEGSELFAAMTGHKHANLRITIRVFLKSGFRRRPIRRIRN
jgi:hypothetical protein